MTKLAWADVRALVRNQRAKRIPGNLSGCRGFFLLI